MLKGTVHVARWPVCSSFAAHSFSLSPQSPQFLTKKPDRVGGIGRDRGRGRGYRGWAIGRGRGSRWMGGGLGLVG